MLRGEGLDIATPTLKTYLLTKKRRKTQPRTNGTEDGEGEQHAELSLNPEHASANSLRS